MTETRSRLDSGVMELWDVVISLSCSLKDGEPMAEQVAKVDRANELLVGIGAAMAFVTKLEVDVLTDEEDA